MSRRKQAKPRSLKQDDEEEEEEEELQRAFSRQSEGAHGGRSTEAEGGKGVKRTLPYCSRQSKKRRSDREGKRES
ncbi:hypothetical protein X777_07807 [Ooceraea biroi]|uniref:Uncharacterized protein n=1 Tax=Ooceraea biroi TaxID=2015173 RepID=A0A026X250_OOCBI|nr:hypothetical protein X777_07807 [Ooceraea biroi]